MRDKAARNGTHTQAAVTLDQARRSKTRYQIRRLNRLAPEDPAGYCKSKCGEPHISQLHSHPHYTRFLSVLPKANFSFGLCDHNIASMRTRNNPPSCHRSGTKVRCSHLIGNAGSNRADMEAWSKSQIKPAKRRRRGQPFRKALGSRKIPKATAKAILPQLQLRKAFVCQNQFPLTVRRATVLGRPRARSS